MTMERTLAGRGSTRRWFLPLILMTFAWRVHALDAQSLWRDEVDAVYFAVRALPESLGMFVQAGQNGALYFMGLRLWIQLAGASEFALRYPSVLVSILAVPLVWQVARRLIPGRLGRNVTATIGEGSAEEDAPGTPRVPVRHWTLNAPLVAAVLLAVNPYQLWYSQEGKMYALVTVLALIASWWWLDGIGRGGWRPWLFYLVTVSVAIYTHLLMVLIIPLHLLWFVVAWPQSRRHWRGYLGGLAGLTLPYLPLIWWQWDLLQAADRQTGFAFMPLPQILEHLLLEQTRGFMPVSALLWLAPVFFLGLAGLLMGMLEIVPDSGGALSRLDPLRRYLLVVSWLLLPVAAIYLISLRQPLFTTRYLIWIAPAAVMLAALGVMLVWHNTGLLARPLTVVLAAYVLGLWLYAGWQQKVVTIKYDLRSAVAYIAARRVPEELLLLQIPHMEYAYRYYSGADQTQPFAGSDQRLGWWAGGLWTNNGLPDEQAMADVDAQMAQATGGADRVWLLRSEVEMWDARHLMDRWLEEHAVLLDQADFHGVQVRLYRFQ